MVIDRVMRDGGGVIMGSRLLQCVAVLCSGLTCVAERCNALQGVAQCVQCVATRCSGYGVATGGRLAKLLSLFCKRANNNKALFQKRHCKFAYCAMPLLRH